jgi:hypothetical protein
MPGNGKRSASYPLFERSKFPDNCPVKNLFQKVSSAPFHQPCPTPGSGAHAMLRYYLKIFSAFCLHRQYGTIALCPVPPWGTGGTRGGKHDTLSVFFSVKKVIIPSGADFLKLPDVNLLRLVFYAISPE